MKWNIYWNAETETAIIEISNFIDTHGINA